MYLDAGIEKCQKLYHTKKRSQSIVMFTVKHSFGSKKGKGRLAEWQGFPGKTLKELHIKSEAHVAVNKLNHNANKT